MKTVVKIAFSAVIASLISVAYRLAFFQVESVREIMLNMARNGIAVRIAFFAILVLVALIVGYCVQNYHTISGSGMEHIPTIISIEFIKKEPFLIPLKFAIGLMCSFCNLCFGGAGVVAYMGALSAKLFSSHTKTTKDEEKLLIYSGSAVALSALLSTPISSALFIVERYKLGFKNIPMILATFLPSIAIYFIISIFMPNSNMFPFQAVSATPALYLSLFFLVAIVFGFELLFRKIEVSLLVLYQKKHVAYSVRIGTAFILSSLFSLSHPQSIGIIYGFMLSFIEMEYSLLTMCIFFMLKLVLVAINFSSSASVGIFLTSLFLGGFLGAIFGTICINYLGVDSVNYSIYIFCGMATFFALANGTPFTAVIFIFELTGNFYFPVILAVILSKSLSPLTDVVLKFINKNNQKKSYES